MEGRIAQSWMNSALKMADCRRFLAIHNPSPNPAKFFLVGEEMKKYFKTEKCKKPATDQVRTLTLSRLG